MSREHYATLHLHSCRDSVPLLQLLCAHEEPYSLSHYMRAQWRTGSHS